MRVDVVGEDALDAGRTAGPPAIVDPASPKPMKPIVGGSLGRLVMPAPGRRSVQIESGLAVSCYTCL